MIGYPAKITYSKSDKCYLVEFPDLPGCLTYGDTLDEAKANAREALTGYLESIDLRKMDIPWPSKIQKKSIHYITPEKRVAFAIWLKWSRQENGFSQKDMSNRLHVKIQSYQKLENPRTTNPTLRTIERVERIFGKNVICV